MKFILPLPPPENERLIFAKHLGRFILSNKYRNYKKEAQWELLKLRSQFNIELLRPTLENQISIIIDVYLPNKKRDGHGCLKALMDVLEGTIYDNDRWVYPRFTEFKVDKSNPRVEINI